MDNHVERIQETVDKLKNASTIEEKEELKQEFWLRAIEAFNENVAGEVITVHGTRLYTPPIEL